MKSFIMSLIAFGLITQSCLASPKKNVSPLVPQPTTCISAAFSAVGDQWWKSMTLKMTNNCGRVVDFQNAAITFETKKALNTGFWGDFGTLSYPDNQLQITSQLQTNGKYLAAIALHFPTYPGANSKLQSGESFSIKYGVSSDESVADSARVYVDAPAGTGGIQLTNTTMKPSDVSQVYTVVRITMNGQPMTSVQLPWNSSQTISGLAPNTYAIAADNLTGTNGTTYQATVNPAIVNLTAGQIASTAISYAVVQQMGKLAINLQSLPTQLAGYTGNPTVTVAEAGGGSSLPTVVNWGTAATLSSLKNGTSYTFSTPAISYNNYTCQPTFNPTSLNASVSTLPTTNLTYSCTQVAQSRVTLNVTGAPTTLASLMITLTPTGGGAVINQSIPLTNGSGSVTALLTTGSIYTVSAAQVPGYTISFTPQPFTATDSAVETITLNAVASGTPVALHGQLTVCGTQLCDEHGDAIQLKGMSSHGIQWFGWGTCLTAGSLDAIANDFKSSVFRISMYIQEGGYESNPTAFTNQVNLLIEEATKRGMYVIVDWHMLTPGDPNYNLARARTFFTEIANLHKNKNNIIYEIANEPNGVSWASIKSYAEQIIPVIRAIDANAPILVGTRAWSSLGLSEGSNSQEIINNPVNATNIMYTFHFYAASHGENYLAELDRASSALPIFVTEFGTQTYSGDGANDFVMSQRYMDLMARKKIGWTNWNFADDFRSGAIWTVGTCPNGPWTTARLKPAGTWIRDRILN